jgi:tetratricopeptide (TPR) repeat protein
LGGELKKVLGILYAMRGEIEKGRDLARAARELERQTGFDDSEATALAAESRVEWYARELDRATELARLALAELEEVKDRESAARVALYLTKYLEEAGKLDEAEAVFRRTRQLTNAAEVSDVIQLDSIEAQLLVRGGRLEDAEELARRAHVAANSTDLYFARVFAASSLALVVELAGRTEEAQQEFEYALGIAEAKGDREYASRLRAHLGKLATVA